MSEPLNVSIGGPMSMGVDLVELDDVARSIHQFGERYLSRLFTTAERHAWPQDSMPECQTTACALGFAAKEAALKAFELADGGVNWRDIEVWVHGRQVFGIRLLGRAAELAAEAGYARWHVGSSVSGGKAMAFVHAQKRGMLHAASIESKIKPHSK
jgi:holo-[acyl-carrier protein] synthase